jgi:hypothetical protein
MDVTVTALKAFPYRGVDVRRGDVVSMDLIDATMYQRYGLVGPTLQQTYQTRELTAR